MNVEICEIIRTLAETIREQTAHIGRLLVQKEAATIVNPPSEPPKGACKTSPGGVGYHNDCPKCELLPTCGCYHAWRHRDSLDTEGGP